MADQDAQNRTLPASPRKLRKAREDGQVARSRDLSHFAAIAGGGLLLMMAAPLIASWLQNMLAEALRFDHQTVAAPAAMGERLTAGALKLMAVVLPVGGIIALGGVVAAIVAGGWNFTTKPMMPKFSKLNPLTGIGRIFSKQQLTDTLKASGLALLLISLGALYLHANLPAFAQALALPLPAAFSHALTTVMWGAALLAMVLAAFALVDLPLQRYLLANRLKMSHQEVKQENKELEGNQEVKGKMRVRMREMSKRRMLAAVPQADLVVMNPTHYAVALKYDDATMAAPRVIAKGADLLALRIRDLARDAKVPVLQAPPLARALYAHAEIDREIPAALFSAVAQVLAYVYQLRAAFAGRGAPPSEPTDLPVPVELDPHHKP
jgi:flagellar biosynthesis protein FlhB